MSDSGRTDDALLIGQGKSSQHYNYHFILNSSQMNNILRQKNSKIKLSISFAYTKKEKYIKGLIKNETRTITVNK